MAEAASQRRCERGLRIPTVELPTRVAYRDTCEYHVIPGAVSARLTDVKELDRSGHLVYDQDCGLCLATAAWLAKRVGPRHLGLLAIGDVEREARVAALVRGRPLWASVHFVRSDDTVLAGARAVLAAGRLVPRWCLLAAAYDHRVGHLLLEPIYRQVAANRRRIGRAFNLPVACPLPPRKRDTAD